MEHPASGAQRQREGYVNREGATCPVWMPVFLSYLKRSVAFEISNLHSLESLSRGQIFKSLNGGHGEMFTVLLGDRVVMGI